MVAPTVEGFSISHAAILPRPGTSTDGLPNFLNSPAGDVADPDWGDIYGVRSGALAPDSNEFDNTGDDAVLSSWFWFNFATVTITSGYIPFRTIAELSGTTITSTYVPPRTSTFPLAAVTTGPNQHPAIADLAAYDALYGAGAASGDYYNIPLWDEKSLNTPRRPMLIRVPSKDKFGATRELDFILFNVQFSPINFTGPDYKAGLVVNYSGKALLSSIDEQGNVLARKAIGRLVSKPVN